MTHDFGTEKLEVITIVPWRHKECNIGGARKTGSISLMDCSALPRIPPAARLKRITYGLNAYIIMVYRSADRSVNYSSPDPEKPFQNSATEYHNGQENRDGHRGKCDCENDCDNEWYEKNEDFYYHEKSQSSFLRRNFAILTSRIATGMTPILNRTACPTVSILRFGISALGSSGYSPGSQEPGVLPGIVVFFSTTPRIK